MCGPICPSSCSSAGLTCDAETQPGEVTTIDGRELSCVQVQNVGCKFVFDQWPFIHENVCPAGLTHDAVIDGPVDCGFLGLNAIFGGSVKNCHSAQQIACSETPSCPTGFTVKNSSGCTVEQQGESTIVQCCQLGSTSTPPDVDDDDEVDANVTNYGQVTQIRIEPVNPVVPVEGELQLQAVGFTRAGLRVELEDDLIWSIRNDAFGNLSLTGIFTACENCHGNVEVTVTHGPLVARTTIEVVQITDYRIEPRNATLTEDGVAYLVATALNLITSAREKIASSWLTDIGSLFPAGGQSSSFAVLTGSDEGEGQVQASVGRLSTNASVTVLSSDFEFTPHTLVVYPATVVLAEEEQEQLVILVKNVDGVYGPLPESIHIDVEDNEIAQMAGEYVKGISVGATTLNISSGALWVIVNVEVTPCTAGTTKLCTAETTGWNFAASGQGQRTCQSDRTWSDCQDIDACDNTPAPLPSGIADGIACGWCSDPSVNDPDCSCSGSEARTCTDALSNCWGRITCSSGTRFGSCIPSPSCTGELFSGTIPSSEVGLFNGYICATSNAIPGTLSMSLVQRCTSYGAVSGSESCSASQLVEMYFNATEERGETWVYIARERVPGVNYTLSDVSSESAWLDINDTSTGESIPILLPAINSSINFNARVTLEGINANYTWDSVNEEVTAKIATLKFEYDNCLFDLHTQRAEE